VDKKQFLKEDDSGKEGICEPFGTRLGWDRHPASLTGEIVGFRLYRKLESGGAELISDVPEPLATEYGIPAQLNPCEANILYLTT